MSGVKRLKLAEVVKSGKVTSAKVNQALSTESMKSCDTKGYMKKK